MNKILVGTEYSLYMHALNILIKISHLCGFVENFNTQICACSTGYVKIFFTYNISYLVLKIILTLIG